MNKWQVLLVKEIKHLFRDTKTIVQTVVVPTFITPLLIGGIFWYVGSIATEETKKTYEVSIYSSSNSVLIDELNKSDRLIVSQEDSVVSVIDAVTQVLEGLKRSSSTVSKRLNLNFSIMK